MFDVVEHYSYEYHGLSNQNEFLSERFGFPYLNGDQCRNLLERKLFLEKEILRIVNDEKLSQTYKDWLDLIDRGRNEMIRNIYGFADLDKYDRALFLVGAEHRKPIMDKIPKFEEINKQELNWSFNYSMDINR